MRIVGKILKPEIIAKGHGIRELARLTKYYGGGSWRKMKGIGQVKLSSGHLVVAELHWYEAHGIGKKECKIKRIFET